MDNVLYIIVILIPITFLAIDAKIMCQDDRGQPVDWFIAYKIPMFRKLENNETAFFYFDGRNLKWRMLKANVSQTTANPLANTLSHIYRGKETDNSMYAMYNDEIPPNRNDVEAKTFHESVGHTKGFINFDQEGGYWMIHSVPKFPPKQSTRGYGYPESGLKYGQVFLCLSMHYGHLDTIGKFFLYNHPQFYDFHLPQKFKTANPNLTSALGGKHLNDEDLLVRTMKTIGGRSFTSFGKSSAYNQDLWTGIASSLKTNLMVESWRTQLNSSCKSEYQVENVIGLRLLNYAFTESQDHAKWAVSKNKKSTTKGRLIFEKDRSALSWTCIGDINRADSQKLRGGGAVCMNHAGTATNFQNIVQQKESC